MEGLKKGILVKNNVAVGAVGDKYFSTCPLGTVLSYAGNIIPRGFLACDGASYKVADYPDLYAVIGNTYGGDSTNFNVPDYRETVLVGVTYIIKAFHTNEGVDGNVQISDNETVENKTWSSSKIASEIGKIGDVYNYQVGSSTQNFVSGINTFSCNTKLHAGLYLFIVTGIHESAGSKDISDIKFSADGKLIRIYYGVNRLPSMCLAYATSVTDNPTVGVQITSNVAYQTYSVWNIQAIRLK